MNTRPKTKQDGPSPYETDDAKWQAVVEKGPGADGEFYYAVKTYGCNRAPRWSDWNRETA